jgi:hypothetical protein
MDKVKKLAVAAAAIAALAGCAGAPVARTEQPEAQAQNAGPGNVLRPFAGYGYYGGYRYRRYTGG